MNKNRTVSSVTQWAHHDFAIDLGTANTLVFLRGQGIVVDEPSLVAMNEGRSQTEVHAVGQEAKEMIGRTPRSLHVIHPLQRGVIADFTAAQRMLKCFISKNIPRRRPFGSRVVISVPAMATSVEARAFKEVVGGLPGIRSVSTVPDPLAGARGAGLPVDEPIGSMLTDIGAGTTESSVISRGGIVISRSIPLAGGAIDEKILHHIRSRYNLIIGERTAEELKIRVASALPLEDELTMLVTGRSITSGLPKTVEVRTNQLCEPISTVLTPIVDLVRRVLEQTPPELSADIFDNGLILSGGGSMLRNIDRMLAEQVGVPVRQATQPRTAVAFGAAEMMKRALN